LARKLPWFAQAKPQCEHLPLFHVDDPHPETRTG
jgi:hypothetical protein